jgi:hypothetical protein
MRGGDVAVRPSPWPGLARSYTAAPGTAMTTAIARWETVR